MSISNAIRINDAFRPGSSERFFNSRNELNASNNRDAFATLAKLMDEVANGRVSLEDTAGSNDNVPTPQERHEHFIEAYKAYGQGDVAAWRDIGAATATTIQRYMTRTGFSRSLLAYYPKVSDPMRIPVEDNTSVVAIISAGSDSVLPTLITDGFVELDYFEVKSNPRVLQAHINKGMPGLVEKAYNKALHGVGIAEDRYYMSQVRRASNSLYGNPVMSVLSGLTPEIISRMRTNIEDQGLPAKTLVTGRSIWPDFVAQPFASVTNPVTNLELIRTGRLATIYDMDIIVDGFRPKNMQVMDPSEMFITAEPAYHGAFSDLGPIEAIPRDTYDDGMSAKGWFISEWIAMAIVNAKSVQLAKRVY